MKTTNGTYVAVVFDETTIKTLHRYIKENSIPNGLHSHELHATILYSSKHCPDYIAPGKYVDPLIGYPEEFAIWEIGEGDKKVNCLVLKFNCLALERRHKELLETHNVSHEFEGYLPHITLSYNCGDLDLNELPDIKDIITKIIITEEYSK